MCSIFLFLQFTTSFTKTRHANEKSIFVKSLTLRFFLFNFFVYTACSLLVSTTAVTEGIQADSDHSNDNLKENEDNNNPLQLLAVRRRQMLLQHIQQVTDHRRALVQKLNTLSNLQITYSK